MASIVSHLNSVCKYIEVKLTIELGRGVPGNVEPLDFGVNAPAADVMLLTNFHPRSVR